MPFNPIYIPIAATPVSQSINPLIGPTRSRGSNGNGFLPFPNGPNVPFPGTLPGAFPRTHSLSGTSAGVPVISFNDFISLIQRGITTHTGPVNGGQDLTYVNLGSLIPNAPEVAIPSISLPATLRGNSGTAVSHEKTQVFRGSQTAGQAQMSLLPRGPAPGLLSSALANINVSPRIPLHPIVALHQAQSLFRSDLQPNQLNSFLRTPNRFVPNSDVLQHIGLRNGQRHFTNSVGQTLSGSNSLQGRIHPAVLHSLSNSAASIRRPPFNPASILNPSLTQTVRSNLQIPVSNSAPFINNRGVQSISSTRFVHQQSRVEQSPNVAPGFIPTQTANRFFSSRPILSSGAVPSASNTPLTVNRVAIGRTPEVDVRNGASSSSVFAPTSLVDRVNGFVRRSSFDDFTRRNNGLPERMRSDNFDSGSDFTIPRGTFDRQFQENLPMPRTVDSPRRFMDRSAFPGTDFRQPRRRFDPFGRRGFTRLSSQNSGLPSSFDERIQQEFTRGNFALPEQFDPVFSSPTDPGAFHFRDVIPSSNVRRRQTLQPFRSDSPFPLAPPRDIQQFFPDERSLPSSNRIFDRRPSTGFMNDTPRPIGIAIPPNHDTQEPPQNSGLPSSFDERIQQEFTRGNFAFPEQFDPVFSSPTDPGAFDFRDVIPPFDVRRRQTLQPLRSDSPFPLAPSRNIQVLPDERSLPSSNRIFDRRPSSGFINDIPRPIGLAIPPNRKTQEPLFSRGDQFRDPPFNDVRQNRFTDVQNRRFSLDDGFEPLRAISAPPSIPSRVLQTSFSNVRGFQTPFQRTNVADPRPVGIHFPLNRGTTRQMNRDPGFRARDPFSGFEVEDIIRNNFADPQNSRFNPDSRFVSPPFVPGRVLQPPVFGDRGFLIPVGRISDPSIIDPVNDFPRPIGITLPPDPAMSPFVGERVDTFSGRGNRFGPLGRLNFNERFDRDNDRFSVRSDSFGPIRNSPSDRRDDMSFTPFFQPRFPPMVRSSGSQFSVSTVSPEMTRFFQRSPDRRSRGSFLISFLVNIDDVTQSADEVGFDANRGVPPSFRNRFFPRDSSLLSTVNRQMGESINRFDDQRGSNRFDDFRRPFQRQLQPRFSGFREREATPPSPRNLMSSIPITVPQEPSPDSRNFPPRSVITPSFRSFSQFDPFTDTGNDVRQDSSRFRPFIPRSLPAVERPAPRPFALAIPDPDGPRNQPFLTAAIEGQFDGPTSSIDINDAFNRRQPILTSEPVVPFPQRRIEFSQLATGTSQVFPSSNALNAQHLLRLGNSVVHSQSFLNSPTSPMDTGTPTRMLISPGDTPQRSLPSVSQSSFLNLRQTSNIGQNANQRSRVFPEFQGTGSSGLSSIFRHHGISSHGNNFGGPTATNSLYISKKAFGKFK